jgi:hypothetical protein
MILNISILTLITCVIIIALEVRRYYKQHLNISIHQIEYINKANFDSLIYNQLPIVIRKTNEQLPLLFTSNDLGNKELIKYMESLHSILSFDHTLHTANSFTKTYTSLKDRTFIGQLKGENKIKLYYPSQRSFLYTSKKNSTHIGFLSSDESEMISKKAEYPLFNKTKYIIVKLKPGNFIYIPYQWSFKIENVTKNTIVSSSNTIVSKLLQWITV